MEPSYLTFKDNRFAYYLKNPEKNAAIVFVHGNSASSLIWQKQFDDPRFDSYTLFGIDLPAHGESDGLADAAQYYNLPGLGEWLHDAVNQVIRKPFIICGSSLGTNVIAEMLRYNHQPAGIFLSGPCIIGAEASMEEILLPGSDPSVLAQDDPDDDQIFRYAGYTANIQKNENQRLFVDQFKKVKIPFRPAFMTSLFAGKFSDEVELLRQFGKPVAWLAGTGETLINTTHYEKLNLPMWRNRVISIHNAGHLPNLDQPEEFNRVLLEFAEEILVNS